MVTADQRTGLRQTPRGMLPARLASVLAQNHTRVLDLFRAADANADGEISHSELSRLLRKLGVECSQVELAQLFETLDQVVGPQHLSLLARELKRKSVACRRYLMQRIAREVDPDMGPVLKARLGDKDADIAFYASLGALALGDGGGLDAVLAVARTGRGAPAAAGLHRCTKYAP